MDYARNQFNFVYSQNLITKNINEIKRLIVNSLNLNLCNVDFIDSTRNAFFHVLKQIKAIYGLDEVIIQSFNFSLMKEIAEKSGFKVTLVDVDESSFLMSFNDLKKKYRGQKVAIITYLYGCKPQKRIFDFLKKNDVLIIEDCAHVPIIFHKDFAGDGDISIYSFNFSKLISAGYGGAIVYNNDKIKININTFISKTDEIKYILKAYLSTLLFNNNFLFSTMIFPFVKLSYWFLKDHDFLDSLSKDAESFDPRSLKSMNILGLNSLFYSINEYKKRYVQKKKILNKYFNLFDKYNLTTQRCNNYYDRYLLPLYVKDKQKAKRILMKFGIDIKLIYATNLGNQKVSKELSRHLIYLPLRTDLDEKYFEKFEHAIKEMYNAEVL